MFLLFLYQTNLDFKIYNFLFLFLFLTFRFNFFYLVKKNKLIFFNLNANVAFFNVKKYFLLLI